VSAPELADDVPLSRAFPLPRSRGAIVTDVQLETLRFLADYAKRHGYAATIREVGAYFGIASTNGANDRIKALERKGLLVRESKTARSIRLTDAGKRRLR
jgi:SOS-response transcriptional repressor LexA